MSPDGSMKPPPPEEKLLRLIRQKPRPERDAATPAATSPEARTVVMAIPRGTPAHRRSWMPLAITGLAAVLAVEVIALIVQAVRPIPVVAVPVVSSAPAPDSAATAAPPVPEMPSLAASASHPLLTAAPVRDASGSVSRSAPSGTAQLLASRLTLLGIVPGDPPQAIIEDAQTKKTYFVTTGQQVVDGAVLAEVRESHVVLDLQGETIELTL